MSKKTYYWEDKPVSRSTYYRMKGKPAPALTDKSVAATRKRLKTEVGRAKSSKPMVANAVDWDRIESFVGVTEQHAFGDPNEPVSVIVPRKWLQSVRKVLPKVA